MAISKGFFSAVFSAVCLFVSLFLPTHAGAENRVLVFAAASMKNVLEVLSGEFEKHCACTIVYSFAGSGTLARQVAARAPADVFISANDKWIEWLSDRNAFVKGSRTLVASNTLVFAVNESVEVPHGADISTIVGERRFAMGEPNSVPAGRYGREALMGIGKWESLKNKAVFTENVRVALALAARGDVSSALIYNSDLKVEPRVKAAYAFDPSSHAAIHYPAVLTSENKLAEQYLKFLLGETAQNVFSEFGFSPPQ